MIEGRRSKDGFNVDESSHLVTARKIRFDETTLEQEILSEYSPDIPLPAKTMKIKPKIRNCQCFINLERTRLFDDVSS